MSMAVSVDSIGWCASAFMSDDETLVVEGNSKILKLKI